MQSSPAKLIQNIWIFRLGDSERNHRHLGTGAAQPICAAITLQVLQTYCFYTGSWVQMFSPQKNTTFTNKKLEKHTRCIPKGGDVEVPPHFRRSRPLDHRHVIIQWSSPPLRVPAQKANGKTEQQDGYSDTNDLSCRHSRWAPKPLDDIPFYWLINQRPCNGLL